MSSSFFFLRIDFKLSGDSVCVCVWASSYHHWDVCASEPASSPPPSALSASSSEPVSQYIGDGVTRYSLLWYIATLLAQKWMSWGSKSFVQSCCCCRFEFAVMVFKTINNTAWTIMASLCWLATITMIDSVSRWWLHSKRVHNLRKNLRKCVGSRLRQREDSLCRHSQWNGILSTNQNCLHLLFFFFCLCTSTGPNNQTNRRTNNNSHSRMHSAASGNPSIGTQGLTHIECSLGAASVLQAGKLGKFVFTFARF